MEHTETLDLVSMVMTTQDSWLTFPWNSGTDHMAARKMEVRATEVETLDINDAVRHTIQTIRSQYPDHKLILMHSGGQKSELIFRQCLHMGIDIEPVFLWLQAGLNDHEYHRVQKIDQEYYKTIPTTRRPHTRRAWLDVTDWMTGKTQPGWSDLVNNHGFVDFRLGMLAWLRHRIAETYGDDVVVLSGLGNIPMYLLPDPEQAGSQSWRISYSWSWDLAYTDYIHKLWPNDIPWFWSYTPELYLSILTNRTYRHRQDVQPDLRWGNGALNEVIGHNFSHLIESRDTLTGAEKFTDQMMSELWGQTQKSQYPEPYSIMEANAFIRLLQRRA